MRRIMLMVTVALVMAAMMATMASSAAATAPVVEEHHEERTVVLADCGDFQVLDRFVLDFTERLFFDQSGTLVRIVATVSGTDTFINSETGKEISTTSHNAVVIDPEKGLGATNGVILRATVPGSGAILLDVGRIVSNRDFSVITFQAGPHQFFAGDLAGLCAALE
jgi:methionine-rich copper-binding protein CopC